MPIKLTTEDSGMGHLITDSNSRQTSTVSNVNLISYQPTKLVARSNTKENKLGKSGMTFKADFTSAAGSATNSGSRYLPY